MAINNSGKWYYLTKHGDIHEGEDPPSGSIVLAAPGATVPDDIVARHGLADRLGEPRPLRDSAGAQLVTLENGRAVALDALPGDDHRRVEAEKLAEAHDEVEADDAKPKAAPKAQGKHVKAPAETKAEAGPAADEPKGK